MEHSVYINACSALAVSQALSPARQQDALDTILFAQLAAGEDFPGGFNDAQWFDVFTSTLSACGWVFYTQTETDELFSTSDNATFSARDTLVASANRNCSGGQVAVLSAALDKAVALSPDSDAAQVFRQHSLLGGGTGMTRIRVMGGIVEANGFLSMTTVSFDTRVMAGKHFVENEVALNQVDGAVSSRFFLARFNYDEFNDYREDTVQWLGGQRGTQSVEIGVLSIE